MSLTFEVGDMVKIKDAIEDKIWIISDMSRDRESNSMITGMYNWEDENDYIDGDWYPEELELYDDNKERKVFNG